MEDADKAARKLSALLELGLTPVDIPPVTSEVTRIGRKKYKIIQARPAMGTLVSITAVHSSIDGTEEAVGRVFEEIDRLIGILSRHDDSTPLVYLNREGSLDDVPAELREVVARALYYHGVSQGAFDISVKPVIDLFAKNAEAGGETGPAPEELREALELTGTDQIKLMGPTIEFGKQGMGITLDGIAKGYIVDRAAAILTRHRIRNFLINAGGDIRTSGRREDHKPWTVAVQDPMKGGEFPDIIHLTDRAVATSGGYEIYFDPAMKFHHIVDSATGRSPDLNASVSVTAPTAMTADALATTLFLMEPEKGIQLMESLPGCESLVVERNGTKMKTKGWRSSTR